VIRLFPKTFLACLTLTVLTFNNVAASADGVPEPVPYIQIDHPEWTRDAVLYQINTRQFTAEGTFAAATAELPRLKKLGVDILWLMPVQKIGKKNRKGKLGSPYSISDYYSVNPEFGDMDSLKQFINKAHEQGMYVILDWVANHTAWDNPILEKHPDWWAEQEDLAREQGFTGEWDWCDDDDDDDDDDYYDADEYF